MFMLKFKCTGSQKYTNTVQKEYRHVDMHWDKLYFSALNSVCRCKHLCTMLWSVLLAQTLDRGTIQVEKKQCTKHMHIIVRTLSYYNIYYQGIFMVRGGDSRNCTPGLHLWHFTDT